MENHTDVNQEERLSYKHWIQRIEKVLIFISMPYTGLAEPLQLMALIKIKTVNQMSKHCFLE